MIKFLVNMSGHPLSDLAKQSCKKIANSVVDFQVPNITMNSSSIAKFIDENMELMKKNK